MPLYAGVPDKPVSALELIQRQQAILAKNGENQRKRNRVEQLELRKSNCEQLVQNLEAELAKAKQTLEQVLTDLRIAQLDVLDLQDESTAEIEADLQNIEAINIKIRANCDQEKAEQEAERAQRPVRNADH